MECKPLLSLSVDRKLFGQFIDELHVEIAVETLKRGTKGNPMFRILCWNYAIVVQNTKHTTSMTKNAREWDKNKNISERQKAKPVNSEFIF